MARAGGDECGGENARREQDALALRIHRTGEQDCRGREAPPCRVAEPQREQQGRDRDEDVQKDVRERLQQSLAEARDDENEKQRGPDQPGGAWRWSRPAAAATAPTRKSQNCTCSVVASAPPIAWNAVASRIGCSGGYVEFGVVRKTCSSRLWKK